MDGKGEEGFIIEGIREDGARFRPGDWIDRLSTLIATFGPDHRLYYSPEVQPCLIDGERCLVISRDLAHKNPEIYQQLVHFANDNQLRVRPDRRHEQLPVSVDRRRPR